MFRSLQESEYIVLSGFNPLGEKQIKEVFETTFNVTEKFLNQPNSSSRDYMELLIPSLTPYGISTNLVHRSETNVLQLLKKINWNLKDLRDSYNQQHEEIMTQLKGIRKDLKTISSNLENPRNILIETLETLAQSNIPADQRQQLYEKAHEDFDQNLLASFFKLSDKLHEYREAHIIKRLLLTSLFS